jgi:hypothetical protein
MNENPLLVEISEGGRMAEKSRFRIARSLFLGGRSREGFLVILPLFVSVAAVRS